MSISLTFHILDYLINEYMYCYTFLLLVQIIYSFKVELFFFFSEFYLLCEYISFFVENYEDLVIHKEKGRVLKTHTCKTPVIQPSVI